MVASAHTQLPHPLQQSQTREIKKQTRSWILSAISQTHSQTEPSHASNSLWLEPRGCRLISEMLLSRKPQLSGSTWETPSASLNSCSLPCPLATLCSGLGIHKFLVGKRTCCLPHHPSCWTIPHPYSQQEPSSEYVLVCSRTNLPLPWDPDFQCQIKSLSWRKLNY